MSKRRKTRHMWTDEEKEHLIMAYLQPEAGNNAWLKARGVNPGWFYKMRQKYQASHPELDLSAAPNTTENGATPPEAPKSRRGRPPKQIATIVYQGQTFTNADIAEYKSLQHHQKAAWLQAHNLNHQSVYEVRKKLALAAGQNGSKNGAAPAPAKTVRELLPAIRTAQAYRVHPKNVPISIPAGPSLDEAICALEVMIDHYTEVVGKLKAMRGAQ